MKTSFRHKRSLINEAFISIGNYLFFIFPVFLFFISCKSENLTPDDYSSLLRGSEGQKISDVSKWEQIQRPYILSLFENEVYGAIPQEKVPVSFKLSEQAEISLSGIPAKREQAKIVFYNKAATDSQVVDLLIYLPVKANKPIPVFLGLNFNGNHTIASDTGVYVTESWVRNNKELGVTDNKSSASLRGASASRWPLDLILSKGYGLATMYYGDIDPDFHDGFKNGVHRLYYTANDSSLGPTEWATISAWAYGLSTALDYLQTKNEIDKDKVIVIGHSRLGKTALWAGATDQRFAIAISNNSGCGGAALSRRSVGENKKKINKIYILFFFNSY